MDTINSLQIASDFFLTIIIELVILFLVVSFLTGLLQEYIPEEKIKGVLSGKRKKFSYFFGSAFGAITPFCSCSTIPILTGLLKAGVPFGACMAFLFASPLLNPIILGLLIAMIGLYQTAVYAVFTFFATSLMGMIVEKAGFESYLKEKIFSDSGSCSCCSCESSKIESEKRTGNNLLKIKNAARFSYGLFRHVFLYLLLGAGIGAFIYGFVPEDLIIAIAGPDNPLAIPLAALIGIPMYIRAETIIPIGTALIGKGMGTGAVMALIIGGAGASIPEVTILSSIFEKKLLAVFVGFVIMTAIIAGLIFQAYALI
ncbi:permease [Methanoplanus sp. FWC-SCC4]|uniref:Permease n=1 Tax=Methanochimaera problematica TaxID=2609417 RepID=A0AA97FFA1_9EURY|nr:permease [Methanoplanus sp. FWC-SCC4]WOF17119.1 permease [Methanoplanus sp. FWC-SCC4]